MSKWVLNEDSTGVLTLEFSGDVWNSALDKSFEKNKSEVKVDGFREGHVPRNIFENKFGVESLFSDAIDSLLEEYYANELTANNIVPVSYPEIAIDKVDKDGVVIKATIAISPDLKLAEIDGLEIEVPVTKVTDEAVNSEIEVLREQNAQLIIKDGNVEMGDIAVIDFAGFKDGVAFDGGTAQNHSLEIGSGQFIPGFEEQVVGMKTNEEKDINVSFPEDYQAEELAGAPVVFKVKVNEIKNREVPELNDDFAAELDMEVKTVVELKNKIRENLESSAATQKENLILDKLLEELSNKSTVTIPNQMIDSEVANMFNEFTQQLSMQGLDINQYFQFTGMDEAKMKEDMRGEALKRVRNYLTLDKLMLKLDVVATDKELDEELEKMAKMYSMEVEAVESAIGGKSQLEYSIKAKKSLEVLKEKAVIKEVTAVE